MKATISVIAVFCALVVEAQNPISIRTTNGTSVGLTQAGTTTNTALTASTAVVTDANSAYVSSSTTAAQIGFLSALASDVQTQVNGKQPTNAGLTSLSGLTAGQITALMVLAGSNGVALSNLSSSSLIGALPAISGAALTTLPAGNLTGTLPAISGANLTGITAANLTGTLPASVIPYRSGVANIGNLSTSQAVVFSSPMASAVGANYYVGISFNSTLAAAISASATSKTTNGFTITLSAGITGGVTADYMAIPYR